MSSPIVQTQFGLVARTFTIVKDLFNTSSINANTNFFTQDLFTSVFPAAEWNIYIVPVASGILTIKRTQTATGAVVSEILNSGAALIANGAYLLSTFVSKGESINLQYSVNSVISKLIVQEMIS